MKAVLATLFLLVFTFSSLTTSVFADTVFADTVNSPSEQVPPQQYTTSWNLSNFYHSYSPTWTMSNLDSDTFYAWYYQINVGTAENPQWDTLQSFQRTNTGSSETFSADPIETHRSKYQITSHVRLLDGFSQIRWKGFVAPNPIEDFDTPSAAIDDAVYQPSSDGFQHTSVAPDLVTTESGSFTLLHYRSPTSELIYDNLEIRIASMTDGTQLAAIEMTDILNYQNESGVPFNDTHFNNFVLLNTSGNGADLFNFVNPLHAGFSFDDLDNPHNVEATTDVYDYAIWDRASNNVEAAGESVWIVAQEESAFVSMRSNVEVIADRSQTVTINAHSPNVWSAYTEQILSDSIEGVISDVDEPFTSEITYSYSVNGTASDVNISYLRQPNQTNYGTTITDYEFELLHAYNIIEKTPLTSTQWYIDQSENPSMTGIIVFLVAVGGAFLFLSSVSAPKGTYVFIYTAAAGVWIYFNLFNDVWISLTVGAIAIVSMVYMLTFGVRENA